jgi:hypothetical protein
MLRPFARSYQARILPFAILLLSGLALPAFAKIPAGDVRIHYYRPDGNYTGWALYTWNASTENNSWCTSEVAITGTDSWTVKISNTAVEFGFDDGDNRDSADFSSSQLKITDLVEFVVGPNSSFQMTFADTAFKGGKFTPVSDSFPLTYSLAGDVLTLNYAGGTVRTGETLEAVFNFTPAPEPSTAGLVLVPGLAALAILAARNRRYKTQGLRKLI